MHNEGKNSDKIRLSFETISHALKNFPFPVIDVVVAIARGGVIPGSMVAHQLNCDLRIVQISYRDENNERMYDEPKVTGLKNGQTGPTGRILLVDDVSVTGSTFHAARNLFLYNKVTTFVLKGNADLVLFPEIRKCVIWPWN
ncbi:MAG: phosphoribosyltransferase [Bacteroidetes bacterium]|nr:phosphoribosyltransferase [Bacteroidota bacterium]